MAIQQPHYTGSVTISSDLDKPAQTQLSRAATDIATLCGNLRTIENELAQLYVGLKGCSHTPAETQGSAKPAEVLGLADEIGARLKDAHETQNRIREIVQDLGGIIGR